MARKGVLLAVLVAACALAARAQAAPGLLVGVDDDGVKWQHNTAQRVATVRDLGLDAVRVTIPWSRGDVRPSNVVTTYLRRVDDLALAGRRVVLAVYGIPADAPTTDAARAQFCSFARQVAVRARAHDVVIWNEVNSPEYWPAAAGPQAYEQLLARCWDVLHAADGRANVITSTAARHDPAGFARALGSAYRASGRGRPIADTFGHNPYPLASNEPPWARHANLVAIGQGDLATLVTAYRDAFAGTEQPFPGGGSSIWYLEDGFQTAVPPDKTTHYTGRETDAGALPTSRGAASTKRDQAVQLRDALYLAYCQPEVGAFFNFELVDETRLEGWQSGLMWADGAKKPSYAAFRAAVASVRARSVDCGTVKGSPQNPVPLPVPPGVIGFTP